MTVLKEPEDIYPLTVALDIAGNPAGNHRSAILHRSGLAGGCRQIVDQIVRLMV